MALPKYKSDDQSLTLMQSAWASQLDPVIELPTNNGLILKQVRLIIGSNIVNTRLSRNLQGWYIVRQRGLASIYDTQDSNSQPNLTLLLTSSANVTVDIFVF